MNEIERIKYSIRTLHQTNPIIHVDVSMNRPKVSVSGEEARIIGVYPNFFQIESNGKRYSVQYTELLMKSIRIAEMDM